MHEVAMLKWMEQLQTIRTELTQLMSAKTAKDFEQRLEALLEKISTNPNVINSLALALNTQSQLKSTFNFGFEKLWKNIQLPNKKDQERTLYILHELQFKIHEMEKEVSRFRRLNQNDSIPIHSRTADNRISVLEKRTANNTITKLV